MKTLKIILMMAVAMVFLSGCSPVFTFDFTGPISGIEYRASIEAINVDIEVEP